MLYDGGYKAVQLKIDFIYSKDEKLTVKVKSQKSSGISGYQVKYRKAGSKKGKIWWRIAGVKCII